MIIKPVSVAVDLDSAASNVSSAVLVSILNTNSTACLIVNSNGNGFYIGAGERVEVGKLSTETLEATTGSSASVWASSVAYLN
jgi:hypothetical protein